MTKWIKPRQWHDGETVTAAWFNIIGSNLEFLKDRDNVHCYHSQDEELRNSQWEVVRWDSDTMDNNELHTNHRIPKHFNEPWSDAKNGSRDGNWPDSSTKKSARININNGGFYLVTLKVGFDSNATGVRKIQFRKNSGESNTAGHALSGIVNVDATSTGETYVTAECIARLDSNDHVNAFAWQSSGGILDIVAGKSVTFLTVVQLSG